MKKDNKTLHLVLKKKWRFYVLRKKMLNLK